MNDDLIGKVYRNGDGGCRYRVLAQDPEYLSLVSTERLSDGSRATAVADFVRTWLDE